MSKKISSAQLQITKKQLSGDFKKTEEGKHLPTMDKNFRVGKFGRIINQVNVSELLYKKNNHKNQISITSTQKTLKLDIDDSKLKVQQKQKQCLKIDYQEIQDASTGEYDVNVDWSNSFTNEEMDSGKLSNISQYAAKVQIFDSDDSGIWQRKCDESEIDCDMDVTQQIY